MTDEEIHNIYLHMSGKAEGLVEATGKADFPVMFARAILEYDRRTKDSQNMASKSTYKEQLETKDEPVAYQDIQEKCKIEVVPAKSGLLREWVELTNKEMKAIVKAHDVILTGKMWVFIADLIDELKEKNNAT